MKRAIIYIIFTFLVASGLFWIPKLFETAPQKDIMSTKSEDSFDLSLTLRVKLSDGVKEMTLREYLMGVVSAEMPETFPSEALKAQAIAARTFALKNANKHPDADICASSACCQGYRMPSGAACIQAVDETDGLVITYEGELIDATYFSCCANRTEAAVAVWGSDIPYLQSVESPDESGLYTETEHFSLDEFEQKLREYYPEVCLDEENNIGKITYTKGGGIDTALIGGAEISGTMLRSIFSLRSTEIDISVTDCEITLTTYGFGHRVGMSQYGAKAMAERGFSFDEILTHYYKDVELRQLYMKKTPPSETEEALFSSYLPMVTTMEANRVSRTNAPATHLVRRASFASLVAPLFLPKKLPELPAIAPRSFSLPLCIIMITINATQEIICIIRRAISIITSVNYRTYGKRYAVIPFFRTNIYITIGILTHKLDFFKHYF